MKNKLQAKILVFLLSIILGCKILDMYATHKIDTYLKTNFGKTNALEYDEIEINFLLGNAALKQCKAIQDSVTFESEKVEINNFSFYQYFINNKIKIESFTVENSKITGKIIDKKKEEKKPSKSWYEKVNIEEIAFKNLNINLTKQNNFPLSIDRIDVNLKDFTLDNPSTTSIPFEYSALKITIKKFKSQFSKVQAVGFSNFTFENEKIQVDSLEIIPLKSRENYIYHVPYEKDLLTLYIKKITVPSFKIHNKKRLFFELDTIFIDQGDFNVYGDRVVLEHPYQRKDLYSKSMRNLPFDIDIHKINIQDTQIVYEELTKKNGTPGLISFNSIHAEINDLTNVERENKFPRTVIHIDSRFMNTSDLKIDWSFKTDNLNDEFTIRGSLLNVPKESINSFMRPTTNVEVEGRINQLFFNLYGNDDVSNGDFEIDFDNFKINLLEDGNEKKSTFLDFKFIY
ncbi:hypothetical protein C7447_10655 [Tenacibaculum adriaticum]|uniref:DUF3971 domain-containing protein n=1 Tax=Tenacibaculum adriaticum TaxID=413713 RepID=A0A5S5DNZ3_9FLAO|nr:hypothetical protein [Tenacibaculum adriaticum]TYP96756.1 hypothetical protein C7447_10655 [Tenacibaculum adriaticum]